MEWLEGFAPIELPGKIYRTMRPEVGQDEIDDRTGGAGAAPLLR